MKNACIPFLVTIVFAFAYSMETGQNWCGLNPSLYNTTTHTCINGNITMKQGQHWCGSIPSLYNTTTHTCINGNSTRKQTQEIPVVEHPKTSQPERRSTTPHHITAKAQAQLSTVNTIKDLECGSVIYPELDMGYQCCGNDVFNPDFDTCCIMSSNKYLVHPNRRHKNYVCCELMAYPRLPRGQSLGLPKGCTHPAMNDKLFYVKRWKKASKRFCNIDTPEYEFILKVHKKSASHGYTYHRATLTRLPSDTVNIQKKEVLVAYDQFSPAKKLQSKTFLILSNVDYSTTLDFYLNPNDHVYRFTKKISGFKKQYKKAKKQCSTSKQTKRHRGHWSRFWT